MKRALGIASVALAMVIAVGGSAAFADEGTCNSSYCPIDHAWEACGEPEQHCIAKEGPGSFLKCGELLPNGVCKQDTFTCVPGNGSGAAAGGDPSGNAIAAAAAQAITNHGNVDPNLQVAAAFGVGQLLGQALVNASNRAAQRKQQQAIVDQAVRDAQEKERAQQEELARQHHLQVMGELKSIDGDSDEGASMRARDGFDTAAADPAPPVRIHDLDQKVALLRPIDADDGPAPGHRIVVCSDVMPKRDRLARGLPVMQESIRRTQAELDAARVGLGKDHEEMHEHAIENLESAIDLLNEGTESIQSMLAHATPLDPAGQAELVLLKKQIWEIHEDWDKAQDLHQLMTDDTLAKARAALLEKDAGRLVAVLGDSKAADLLGDKLAEVGGPYFTISFEVGKAAIDVSATTYAGHIDARDLEQAKQNLAVLQNQERNVETQLKDLDGDILQGGCGTR